MPYKTSKQQKEALTRLRLSTLVAYGGKCVCCGEWRERILTLDHVVPVGKSRSTNMYAAYQDAKSRNYPADYQVLCMSCNWLKRDTPSCPCASLTQTAEEALAAVPAPPGMPSGYDHYLSKPPAVVAQVREMRAAGASYRAIARALPVSYTTVERIVTGATHG